MPPRLSICIPTHNGRAQTLEEAIGSVLTQVGPEHADAVEICVSDNASKDGTAELMAGIISTAPVPVTYRRNQIDLGPAHNTVLAVEMAHGDYCWLFSSDDWINPGALDRVLELLNVHDGIVALSVDQAVFDVANGRELPGGWLDYKASLRHTNVIEGTQTIVEELGLIFTGISLSVFDRLAWERVVQAQRDRIVGGHGLFAHAVVLAQLASDSPRWLWCPEPLVRNRLVLDPSANRTWFVPRFLDDLSRALRPHLDDAAYQRVFRYVTDLAHPTAIISLRQHPRSSWRTDTFLAKVFFRRGRWVDGFWSQTVPALLLPRSLLRLPWYFARASRAAMWAYRRVRGAAPLRARIVAAPRLRGEPNQIEPLTITIENLGRLPLFTWWPLVPLHVWHRWEAEGRELENRGYPPRRLHGILRHGRSTQLGLRYGYPSEPGRYRLSIGLSWDGIWLEETAWSAEVEVAPARPRGMRAPVAAPATNSP